MRTIQEGFTNYKGCNYPNIRNIHFDQLSDMVCNIGELRNESKCSGVSFFTPEFDEENGIYIYQANYDRNKALRIYKDFADYKYTYYCDDKFISELLSKQGNIKLTDFPTGIVSVENKVIGQEVPYYNNSCTLGKMVSRFEPMELYLDIVNILKELCDNGIIYSDIHVGNFMVDIESLTIKLIDFETKYVTIDDKSKYLYKYMIANLKGMLTKLNEFYNICFSTDLEVAENLDQITNCIMEKQYFLIK